MKMDLPRLSWPVTTRRIGLAIATPVSCLPP
jgi:hypothetical protein